MNRRRDQEHRIGGQRPTRLRVWLLRHAQVALASLGRLARSPLSSLMTVLVLGIALSLPTGLHLLLKNVQQLAGGWDGAATISLYLQRETSPVQARRLADRIRGQAGIEAVELIGRDQALAEFRRLGGFAGALDALEGNPLPDVVVVHPDPAHSDPDRAAALLQRLQRQAEVEFGQLDLEWVRRFQAITEIARRAVLVLAVLLGMAVLLVVVNTIRLEIQNRRPEIEITKLIGGTDAFIRRPFLYLGIWYGLLGGLTAWLLVSLSLWLLSGPVARLAGLYDSGFQLAGIDAPTLAGLLGLAILLGLGGAWLAVARHLREIEPA